MERSLVTAAERIVPIYRMQTPGKHSTQVHAIAQP